MPERVRVDFPYIWRMLIPARNSLLRVFAAPVPGGGSVHDLFTNRVVFEKHFLQIKPIQNGTASGTRPRLGSGLKERISTHDQLMTSQSAMTCPCLPLDLGGAPIGGGCSNRRFGIAAAPGRPLRRAAS
jgi:hypothetical protein